MKQKTNKVLSIILAVIMLTMLFSQVITASAEGSENTVVSQIDLGTVPGVGETADNKALPYGRDTETFTATGAWYVYDHEAMAYKIMAETETFAQDCTYRQEIIVELKDGYVLDSEPTLIVNETEVNDISWFNETSLAYVLDYFYGEAIDEVVIEESAFPKAVLGEDFSYDEIIDIPMPAGSNYTVKGYWLEIADGEYKLEGTFEDGKVYEFYYTVYADKGYYFAEDVMLNIDNVIEFHEGGMRLDGFIRTSFLPQISEFTLLDVPKAELGKTVTVGEFDIKVPEGANYTATAMWYDENSNPIENGKVENGKSYTIGVDIHMNSGYEFADEIIATVNGVKIKLSSSSPDFCYYERTYSYREKINYIEIIGVTEPVIGAAPTTEGIKSAEPDKYVINGAMWVDTDTGEENPAVFEDGHTYILYIDVIPADGYELARFLTYKIGDTTNVASIAIYARYSFKTVIPKIEVSDIPSFKVGEKASFEVTVPEDAKYTAQVLWTVWDDEEGMYMPFEGTFEKGKAYKMDIDFTPEEGYEFNSKTTEYYEEGKLSDNIMDYGYGAFATFRYAEGLKVIDKVDITVKEPVAGDHTSIDPVVTLPDGANYSLTANFDPMWMEGSEEYTGHVYNTYFEDSANYGVYFSVTANEGYIFAEDLTLIINGKTVTESAVDLLDAKQFEINYLFGMDDKSEEENDNPPTSDNMNLIAIASVMAVCAIGAVVLKKRNYN